MKRRKLLLDQDSLAKELARLPQLDRRELIGQWQLLYQSTPPARVSNQFLMHAIAYRLQEQALGGIKPATCRYLQTIACAGKQAAIPAVSAIRPGTRLLREWHGITYEVLIEENGITFKGKRYRSLSEVASIITGAKWSGPLFFGLKKEVA